MDNLINLMSGENDSENLDNGLGSLLCKKQNTGPKIASNESEVELFNADMIRLRNTIDARREAMNKRMEQGDYEAKPEYDLIGVAENRKIWGDVPTTKPTVVH
jgi:hypothetical protein